jgi:hypothetical protein
MWITTHHRFANRAAFDTAFLEAGWPVHQGVPELPYGVVLDVVAPISAPARVGPGGEPISGEAIDPRYQVNLAWHGCERDPAFEASLVIPATPSRGWDVSPAPVSQPPVPPVILSWKRKAVLREAGLLETVETAVKAADGRVRDAWQGAAEWQRDSEFLTNVADALGLSTEQVDQMFREADSMRG